jgi:hypothetical protein
MLLAGATASHAAINEQGAGELKTLIKAYLDEQKNVYAASGAMMEMIGDIEITPKGGYYNIVLPHIKTTYPGDTIMNFGKIVINAAPGEKQEDWKISYSLPKDISITDSDGEVTHIDIGSQSASGIWNTNLNYIPVLKAQYKDISISNPADTGTRPVTGTIKAIDISQDLKDSGQNLWSGPMTVTAKDIAIQQPSREKLTIEKVTASYTLADMNPKGYQELRKKFSALGEQGISPTNLAMNTDKIADTAQTALSLFENPMGSMSSEFMLENVKFTQINEAAEQTGELLSLGRAKFGLDLDLSNPDSTGFGLRLSANDIKQNFDASQQKFSPQQIDLDIKVKNFPMKSVMKNTSNELDKNSAAPSTPLIMLLSKAGTNIENTFLLDSESVKISGKGTLRSTSTSPFGANADQQWEITGLNTLMTEMGSPSAEHKMPQQIMGPLAILQMMGQISPENPDKRTYRIIANDQGITVNGADISTLMGAVATTPPPAQ